jgi:hypothetical protein
MVVLTAVARKPQIIANALVGQRRLWQRTPPDRA